MRGVRKEIFESTVDVKKRLAATSGVIHGISDDYDYSEGAYFWQGVDLHKHYNKMRAYEDFYLVGFKFTNSSDDIWKLGNHKAKNKAYNYMFESTTTQNKTTFIKYTDEYLKTQKAKVYP